MVIFLIFVGWTCWTPPLLGFGPAARRRVGGCGDGEWQDGRLRCGGPAFFRQLFLKNWVVFMANCRMCHGQWHSGIVATKSQRHKDTPWGFDRPQSTEGNPNLSIPSSDLFLKMITNCLGMFQRVGITTRANGNWKESVSLRVEGYHFVDSKEP